MKLASALKFKLTPIAIAFALFATSVTLKPVTAQQIVVDPDNDGSTNVLYNNFGVLTPLNNPVSNPLDLTDKEFFVGNTAGGTAPGALLISNGASATTGAAQLGLGVNATGTATVDGTGSLWNVSGTMIVGTEQDSNGVLNVTNGGRVAVDGAGQLDIGTGTGSTGLVNVSGANSRIDLDSILTVGTEFSGSNANATLNITQGGNVTVNNSNSTVQILGGGAIAVDGAGSILDASSAQVRLTSEIDFEETTRMDITNGGQVNTRELEIGTLGTSSHTAEITVSGNDSKLNVRTTARIGTPFAGLTGNGRLTIGDGGFMNTKNLAINANNDGNITGRVDLNTGGTIRIEETLLRFGRDGVRGKLNLNGGTLVLAGDRTYDGSNESNNLNSVLTARSGMVGTGVNLKVEGELDAIASITIDGGSLSAGSIRNANTIDLRRGKLELTASDVDVDDSGLFGSTVALETGQHLKVDQMIRVGSAGRVELSGGRIGAGTIENKGVITGSGRIDGPINNQQNGNVLVGSGDSLFVSGAGSTNGWNLQMAGGMLEFDSNLTNAADGRIAGRGMLKTAGNGLSNEGDLLVSGGPMDIVGDVDNIGLVDVSGGGTATFYDDVVNNGTMRVVSVGNTHSSAVFFGDYSGAGDITGGGDVFMLGDLRPGNSPASVQVAANMIFGIDTDVQVELAGLDAGDFDQFLIDGDLSLAGDLVVNLISGFQLDADKEFIIFDVEGTANGLFNNLDEGDLVTRFGDVDLRISYAAGDGNDIALQSFVSAVPEPGSFVLIGFTATILVNRRRRFDARS